MKRSFRFRFAPGLFALFGGEAALGQIPEPYPEGPSLMGAWDPPVNLWAQHSTSDCDPALPGVQPCYEIAHAVLLPVGPKAGWVLYWRNDPTVPQDAYIWDPRSNQVFGLPVTDTALSINGNIFCSGHSFLPDGRLLVAGGVDYSVPSLFQGTVATWVFDPTVLAGSPPTANPWSYFGAMQKRRYYPTTVALADGSIAVFGGLVESPGNAATCGQPLVQNSCLNDDFEVLPWNNGNPVPGSWTLAVDQNSPPPQPILGLPGTDQFVLYAHVKLMSGFHA